MSHRARAVLLFVIVACFSVLIFGGAKISEHKPPIPERVVAPSGEVVLTGDDIRLGQRQYLSRGGQQTGSIWGHGAYVAPDWSADWLHREAVFVLDRWAGGEGGYERLPSEQQAALITFLLADEVVVVDCRDGFVLAHAFSPDACRTSWAEAGGIEGWTLPWSEDAFADRLRSALGLDRYARSVDMA